MFLFWIILFLSFSLSSYVLNLQLKTFSKIQKDFKSLSQEDKIKYACFIRKDIHSTNYFKIIFCTYLLFPPRLILFLTIQISFYIFMVITNYGKKYMESPNRIQYFLTKVWIKLFVKLFLIVIGVYSIDFEGVDAPKDKPYIIISNHISLVDSFVYVYLYTSSFVAKSEIQNWPLFGAMFKVINIIFVDRNSKDNRDLVMDQIKQRIQKKEYPLFIFPEGTTTNGQYLLQYKQGAFQNRNDLIVNYIQLESDFDPFIDHNGNLFSIFGVFCNWKIKVKVRAFLMQIKDEESVEDYIERVRNEMKQRFNLQLTNLSYPDTKVFQRLIDSLNTDQNLKKQN